ncbi:MAG TPA: GNAT family N-acetyltransferase [Arsenicitalea sp.]|jgi:ribosomal protein S18 acetylase RimI-like enzyme|nr:GNAT family N-acetyltransferase [Arsenicitalea sp.]
MKLKDVAWRAMTAFDLPEVEKIAAQVHPGFFEAAAVLAEKQALYRNGAYMLEIGERPSGYVLSHPWTARSIPALNALLVRLPPDAGTYYIHDLALLPVARRVGAASHIVEALAKHGKAHGFATMSLVAVNGSRGFWERHGFAVEDVPELAEKLLGYEAAAKFMVKRLS